MKVLRATGSAFIFLGLSILFFVLYELVGTSAITKARQSDLQSDFQFTLDAIGDLPGPFTGELPIPRPSKPRSAVNGIARLRIPRIGVNVIVVEGVTLERLAYGPGHYPSTADLDAKGVAAIAGHRTGWSAPFFNLDKLRPGDQVIVETPHATYTYRMITSRVVSPSHSEVLQGNPRSTADKQLVLTTCTPKFTARDRLIIFLDIVQEVPRA
ncbi:MAG: sortase [Actinomycetota bacterium]